MNITAAGSHCAMICDTLQLAYLKPSISTVSMVKRVSSRTRIQITIETQARASMTANFCRVTILYILSTCKLELVFLSNVYQQSDKLIRIYAAKERRDASFLPRSAQSSAWNTNTKAGALCTVLTALQIHYCEPATCAD